MKKIHFICYVLILFVLIGCTMNEKTGLITISNYMNGPTIDVRLNGVSIGYVGSGVKYDYWFYNNLSGGLQAFTVDKLLIARKYDDVAGGIDYTEATSCHFKLGYRYEIRVIKVTVDNLKISDSLNIAYVEPGIKVGANKDSSDFYDYPGQ